MNAEGAGMAEHFKHFGPCHEPGRCQSILPLIAKPTGLLPLLDIDKKLGASLLNLNLSRATTTKKSSFKR